MAHLTLPGMQDFMKNNGDSEEGEEFFVEGKELRYFDAAILPDTPDYQRNAFGNQTYVLHIIFPSQEELVKAISALTMGYRKSIAKTAKEGTINGVARRKDGLTWLEHWENIMLGASNTPVREEETEPEIIPGETYSEEEEVPEKPKKQKKSKPEKKTIVKVEKKEEGKKKEIPVKIKYPSKLSIYSEDVLIAFPTYRRSNDVKTWRHFDEGLVVGYVETQEHHLYCASYPGENIVVYGDYPAGSLTINQKRNMIVENAMQDGKRWLFMLEDDLTGFFKRDGKTAGGSHKLTRCEYKEVMDSMLNFANANGIAELGLSQQQSNHYYEEDYVKFSCKVTEFCLFDLNVLKETNVNYDVSMPHFEDFDISIQLLMAEKKVGLFTPYAFGHVTMATNKSGGFISDGMEKRKKLAEEAIAKMVEKYPEIVKKGEGRLFPEPKVNWSALREMIKE